MSVSRLRSVSGLALLKMKQNARWSVSIVVAASAVHRQLSDGSLVREERIRAGARKLDLPSSLEDLCSDLLNTGTLFQPGGRDPQGRPIVVISGLEEACCLTDLAEQIARLILYYYNITSECLRSSGIAIIVDARISSFESLNVLLKAIYTVEASLPGIVSNVIIVASEVVQSFICHSPEYRPHINLKINVVSNFEKLHSLFDASNLPKQLEGSIRFDFAQWLEYRRLLEECLKESCDVAALVVKQTRELTQTTTFPQSISEARSMLEGDETDTVGHLDAISPFLLSSEAKLAELTDRSREIFNAADFKDTPESVRSMHKQVCESLRRLQTMKMERRKRLMRYVELKTFEIHYNEAVDVLNSERLKIASLPHRSRDTSEIVAGELKDFENLTLSFQENLRSCFEVIGMGEELVRTKQDGEESTITKIKESCLQLSSGVRRLESEIDNILKELKDTSEFFLRLEKVEAWKNQSNQLLNELDEHLTNASLSKVNSEQYISQLNSLLNNQDFHSNDELAKALGNDALLGKWQHCRRCIKDVTARLQSKQIFLRKRASETSRTNSLVTQNSNIPNSDNSSIIGISNQHQHIANSTSSDKLSPNVSSVEEQTCSSISSPKGMCNILSVTDLERHSEAMDTSTSEQNKSQDLDCIIPFCPEEQLSDVSPQRNAVPQISTSGVKLRPRKVLKPDSAWSTSTPFESNDRSCIALHRQSYGGTPSARQPVFDVRGYMLNPDRDGCSSPTDQWFQRAGLTSSVHEQSFQRAGLTSSARYNRISADCSVYSDRLSGLWNESDYSFTPEKQDSVATRKLSTLPASVSGGPVPERPRKQKWKMLKRAISLFTEEKEGHTGGGWSRRNSWRTSQRAAAQDRTTSIESLPGLVEDLTMLDAGSMAMMNMRQSMQSCCRFGWGQISPTARGQLSTPTSGSQFMFANRYATRIPSTSELHAQPIVDRSAADHELRQQRLSLIMSELITTEKDYINSLAYVIDHYIPEIQRDDVIQPLRGKKNVVFENIEKIHDFHCNVFHDKILACATTTPYELGACFLQHESEFYFYALYSKNKPKSDSLMNECGAEYFKTKQRELRDNMDLSSYLLKPVQRMGKYALLLKQIMKECPETHLSYPDLKAALEMVRFQLRHGNNLLAMDCLRGCDVNVQEQGMLLRQEEFLVYHGRRKCLRHVFLFEELLLFSKAKHQSSGQDLYVYKNSIKTSDLGLTETAGDSGCRFEVWFRKRQSSTTWVLKASTPEVKSNWTRDISRILWKQTIRNKERRQVEMACMGIGGKPSLDIKTSNDNISDRLIEISAAQKVLAAARLRNSTVSEDGSIRSKRPHSLISVSSSSSSGSGFSSGYSSGLSSGPTGGHPGLTSSHSAPTGWCQGPNSSASMSSGHTAYATLPSTAEESFIDIMEQDRCESEPILQSTMLEHNMKNADASFSIETPPRKSSPDLDEGCSETTSGLDDSKIDQDIPTSPSNLNNSQLSDASTQTTLKRPGRNAIVIENGSLQYIDAECGAIDATQC